MRHFARLPKALALAAVAVLAASCGDQVTDPQAFLDSAEAEAVLRSALALPALPTVIDRAGDPDAGADRLALYRAQELWAAGLAGDDPRSRASRRLAIRYATPALSAALEPADLDRIEQELRLWGETAGSMLRHIDLPRVEARLAGARVQLDRAAAARDRGARVLGLLLAGSELVETTPRFVARAMVADADRAVGRAVAAAADPEDPVLARAVRLKDWAARAVEEGDDLLAIQRAYYAMQLVEAR